MNFTLLSPRGRAAGEIRIIITSVTLAISLLIAYLKRWRTQYKTLDQLKARVSADFGLGSVLTYWYSSRRIGPLNSRKNRGS